MFVYSTFCSRLHFCQMQKFVFNGSSSGTVCKNIHCASVMNAEDVTEPRLTLKQIERQKLEKRSKYNDRITMIQVEISGVVMWH